MGAPHLWPPPTRGHPPGHGDRGGGGPMGTGGLGWLGVPGGVQGSRGGLGGPPTHGCSPHPWVLSYLMGLVPPRSPPGEEQRGLRDVMGSWGGRGFLGTLGRSPPMGAPYLWLLPPPMSALPSHGGGATMGITRRRKPNGFWRCFGFLGWLGVQQDLGVSPPMGAPHLWELLPPMGALRFHGGSSTTWFTRRRRRTKRFWRCYGFLGWPGVLRGAPHPWMPPTCGCSSHPWVLSHLMVVVPPRCSPGEVGERKGFGGVMGSWCG